MQASKHLTFFRRLALAVAVIGLILMVGKIVADGEPGLLPLLLIVLGTGAYWVMRRRGANRRA